MAPVTATGVPKPAAPSKKATEAEGDQQKLQPAVARDRRDAVLKDRELATFSLVELIEER